MKVKRMENRTATTIAILTLIVAILALIPPFASLLGYEWWFQQELVDFEDDFNLVQYDGSFNNTLWQNDTTRRVSVGQQNGVMMFSTGQGQDYGNNALRPIDPERWSFRNFEYLEADMKLDSRYRGEGSHVKIQVVTVIDDEIAWWAECQISNANANYGEFFCNTYSGDDWVVPPYEYETQITRVDYDTFYRARIEKDANTGEFRFFLDGHLVGSHTPNDIVRLRTTHLYPQIGMFTGSDENVIGYFDNVRIR